jgi:hypothetical protein
MDWAADEFDRVDLGDKRLDSRLVKLCNSLSDAPESPINQACEDWHETKAAYRFFQNEHVEVDEIMIAHRDKTSARAINHGTILALQDTSYFVYTHHPKTKGLGEISMKKGKNIDKIYSRGLVMHTCFAVTTKGTPLGLLDQKIFARELRPDHERRSAGGKYVKDVLPVEEKESYRWIEALEATSKAAAESLIVTVCDRECDFYDFYKAAEKSSSAVLVRASQNRINRGSRYAKKDVEKLWGHIVSKPESIAPLATKRGCIYQETPCFMGFRAPSNTVLPYGLGTKLLHSCLQKGGQVVRSRNNEIIGSTPFTFLNSVSAPRSLPFETPSAPSRCRALPFPTSWHCDQK